MAETEVWQFVEVDSDSGTGLLGRTVIELVTHHTQPGDRVLLATTKEPHSDRSGSPNSCVDPADVGWAIARLGRSVRVLEFGESGSGPGSDDVFALVVIVAPEGPIAGHEDWLWSHEAASRGRVAVITSGQPRRGGCAPVTAVVNAARNRGFGWLQHVAVENAPPSSPAPIGPADCSLRVRRLHYDVLVFAPIAAGGIG